MSDEVRHKLGVKKAGRPQVNVGDWICNGCLRYSGPLNFKHQKTDRGDGTGRKCGKCVLTKEQAEKLHK